MPHDARWQARFDDIPHLVDSAEAKFRQRRSRAPLCSMRHRARSTKRSPCSIAG